MRSLDRSIARSIARSPLLLLVLLIHHHHHHHHLVLTPSYPGTHQPSLVSFHFQAEENDDGSGKKKKLSKLPLSLSFSLYVRVWTTTIANTILGLKIETRSRVIFHLEPFKNN